MHKLLLPLAIVLLTAVAHAQAPAAKPTLQDFAWLAGHWRIEQGDRLACFLAINTRQVLVGAKNTHFPRVEVRYHLTLPLGDLNRKSAQRGPRENRDRSCGAPRRSR